MKIAVSTPEGAVLIGFVDGPNQRDALLIACREVSGVAVPPPGFTAEIVDLYAETPATWPPQTWQQELPD